MQRLKKHSAYILGASEPRLLWVIICVLSPLNSFRWHCMGGEISLPIVSENISSSWNTVASFRGEAIDGTCPDNVLSGGLSDKCEGRGHPTMTSQSWMAGSVTAPL